LKDGDFTIVLCPLRDFGWQDSSALGFWRSRFVQFAPREEPPPKPRASVLQPLMQTC